MNLVRFKLKIPVPDNEGEYKEFYFNSPKEICEELGICESALYAICNKTYKWSHKQTKHLKGIIIERETIYAKKKEKIEDQEEKKKQIEDDNKRTIECHNTLIEKLSSK